MALVDGGALPTLLLLATSGKEARLKLLALRAISHCAMHPQTIPSLLARDAPGAILGLIRRHLSPIDSDVVEPALATLFGLCSSVEGKLASRAQEATALVIRADGLIAQRWSSFGTENPVTALLPLLVQSLLKMSP